jgi:Fe-S cluster assembly scaffold protein SufB
MRNEASIMEAGWRAAARETARAALLRAPAPTFKYGLGAGLPASGIALPSGDAAAARWRTAEERPGAAMRPWSEGEWSAWAAAPDERPAAVGAWQVAYGRAEAVLDIPDGFDDPAPLRLTLTADDPADRRAFAGRLLIRVGRAAAPVIVIDETLGGGVGVTQVDVAAGAGSRPHLALMSRGAGVQHSGCRVRAEAGAHVTVTSVVAGRGYRGRRLQAELVGAGAALAHRGLALGGGGLWLDDAARVGLRAPDTHATESLHAVLGRIDKAVTRARVSLRREAVGSTGLQRANALLAAPGAEFSALPEFEAEQDQVRCRHGAAVSGFDAERLFYLQSRGLGRAAASALLVRSFAADALAAAGAAGLNDELEAIMAEVTPHLTYEA